MDALQLIGKGKLSQALVALQDLVRKDASNPKHRIFLFQLLSVMGQWNRALTQLNVAAELDAAALPMAQTYREAIQCEALRAEIFAGKRLPLVFGEPQPWLALMFEALRQDASGNVVGAARSREQAFEDAPAIGGSIDGNRFEWMGDADQRLGPALEAVVNGRYFWIPYERISRIEVDPPADLRDLVWTAVTFTWTNGASTVGLVPTRYPDTVTCGVDELLLARRTEWVERGRMSGYGLGQRMLATDSGDYALMDVRAIEFGGFEGGGIQGGDGPATDVGAAHG
jgi:type VI secretion system protein ImpE